MIVMIININWMKKIKEIELYNPKNKCTRKNTSTLR